MKRCFALILTLSLCLSLVACGKKSANKNEQFLGDKVYDLGDTIETELFQVTPTFTGYATKLTDQYYFEDPLIDPGLNESVAATTASDGKVFMYGEILVEYIGNKKENVYLQLEVCADYDDGYVFDDALMAGLDYGADDFFQYGDYEWGMYDSSSDFDDYIDSDDMCFEALSEYNTRLLRFCLEVPQQVEANPDKPLLVTISLNGENYTYDFRSATVRSSN